MRKFSRRDFIKAVSLTSLGMSGKLLFPQKLFASSTGFDVIAVKGDSPFKITEKTIEVLGGMKRFISRGDVVVIKPNIGWDRKPEQAANTNPVVVGALVRMAYEAGAKRVRVLDNTCNDARRCYVNSGIEKTAKKYGAEVKYVEDFRLRDMNVKGQVIKRWKVYKDFIECDALINVPVLKHHGLSGLTMGMKNWIGAIGGRRSVLHQNIDDSVVDLAQFFKPKLTVLDAFRVLLRNGPQGGSLGDVSVKKIVAASKDPVAIDSFGAKIFGANPRDLGFIREGNARGLGRMNVDKVNILKI